jgi:hypothetical protein
MAATVNVALVLVLHAADAPSSGRVASGELGGDGRCAKEVRADIAPAVDVDDAHLALVTSVAAATTVFVGFVAIFFAI